MGVPNHFFYPHKNHAILPFISAGFPIPVPDSSLHHTATSAMYDTTEPGKQHPLSSVC